MMIAGVISRVRSVAGDIDAQQFTNDQIINWINDGIRECALANNLLQKRISQMGTVGSSDYSLPSDILKIHSVKYNNEKLRALTLEEFDEYYAGVGQDTDVNPASPGIYYIWAGTLTLYPSPDVSSPLVIDYIYTPPELTTDSGDVELPLPIGYHNRIVDYCLAQVAQQDDDINRYQAKMQEFYTGVQTLKDQPETQEDLFPFISVSSRDTSDYLDDWNY